MMWECIGERIKRLRQKRKLSRKQFGALVGISGQYLGSVERGTHGLSVNSIISICNKTGVSADHILFGTIDLRGEPAVEMLNELSHEQIEIVLQIIKKVAQFVNTEDGNEVLIREVVRNMHNP